MSDLIERHDPLPDCDCGDCARFERNRLRKQLLEHAETCKESAHPISDRVAALEARNREADAAMRDLDTNFDLHPKAQAVVTAWLAGSAKGAYRRKA